MEKLTDTVESAWMEYSKQLLSFIRTKVDSSKDAEDILAEVFYKLAKLSELSRIPTKLPNWLYRVTYNTIIDYYRKKKPTVALPDELSNPTSEPEAISKLSACILPIIEELSDTYRYPLLLAEIDEKSHQEVADILGISLSATKSRILRGRRKLKDLMSKRCTFYHDKNGQLIDFKENIVPIIDHS
jgi:RNA polymerase sigma-70 factor (ECF subfamily)